MKKQVFYYKCPRCGFVSHSAQDHCPNHQEEELQKKPLPDDPRNYPPGLPHPGFQAAAWP